MLSFEFKEVEMRARCHTISIATANLLGVYLTHASGSWKSTFNKKMKVLFHVSAKPHSIKKINVRSTQNYVPLIFHWLRSVIVLMQARRKSKAKRQVQWVYCCSSRRSDSLLRKKCAKCPLPRMYPSFQGPAWENRGCQHLQTNKKKMQPSCIKYPRTLKRKIIMHSHFTRTEWWRNTCAHGCRHSHTSTSQPRSCSEWRGQ